MSLKVAANIGELSSSHRYKALASQVQEALKVPSTINVTSKETLEDEDEYKLILECNKLVQEIDEEILGTYVYVSEIYNKKFPELSTIIPNKIDYIRAVQRIGNQMDLTEVNLSDILSNQLVMIVTVAGSTTAGTSLSPQELNECFRGCSEILKLESDKISMFKFVESRMNRIAPNLCALIGAHVAAKLVGLAGGLIPLSKIPSCNIQVMGQEKKNLAGLSNNSIVPHTGVLFYCDLVQNCPPEDRRKALKVVAGKVVLAARIDSYQTTFDGLAGENLRRDIEDKWEKMAEPHMARTKKALPIPEEKKRSKRGGKRVRKQKEALAMTELRKQQNKMVFTAEGGEYGDSAMGWDNGMVGTKQSGHVRGAAVKESKFIKRQKKAISVSSAGQASGLSSSLSFTPVQGLELVNPLAAAERVKEANNKWFNAQTGFLSAAPR